MPSLPNSSRFKLPPHVKPQALVVIFMFAILPIALLLLYQRQIFFNRAAPSASPGLVLTHPSVVNQEASGLQTRPDVGSSGEVLYATWRSQESKSADASDVFVGKSGDQGGTWDKETKLTQDPVKVDERWNGDPSPSIAVASEKEAMVVWGGPSLQFSRTTDGGSWSPPTPVTVSNPAQFTEVKLNAFTPQVCFSNCPKVKLFINGEYISTNDRGYLEINVQQSSNELTFTLPSGRTYSASDEIAFYIYDFDANHPPKVRKATVSGVETTWGIVDSGSMEDQTALDCKNTTPLTGLVISLDQPATIRFQHNCEGLPGFDDAGENVAIAFKRPQVVNDQGKYLIVVVESREAVDSVVLYQTTNTTDWRRETISTGSAGLLPGWGPARLAVSSEAYHVFWYTYGSGIRYSFRRKEDPTWPTEVEMNERAWPEGFEPFVLDNQILLLYANAEGLKLTRADIGSTSFSVGPTIFENLSDVSASGGVLTQQEGKLYALWGTGKTSSVNGLYTGLYASSSPDGGVSWGSPQLLLEDKGRLSLHPRLTHSGNEIHVAYSSTDNVDSEDFDVYHGILSPQVPPPEEGNKLIVTAKASFEDAEKAPKFLVRISGTASGNWYVGSLSGTGRVVTTVTNTAGYQEYTIPLDEEVPSDAEVDIILVNGSESTVLDVSEIRVDAEGAWGAVASTAVFDAGEIADDVITPETQNWNSIFTAFDCQKTRTGGGEMKEDGGLRFNSSCQVEKDDFTCNMCDGGLNYCLAEGTSKSPAEEAIQNCVFGYPQQTDCNEKDSAGFLKYDINQDGKIDAGDMVSAYLCSACDGVCNIRLKTVCDLEASSAACVPEDLAIKPGPVCETEADCVTTTNKPDLFATGIDVFRSSDPNEQTPDKAVPDNDLKVGETVYLRVNLENIGDAATGAGFFTRWDLPPGYITDNDFHLALDAKTKSTQYTLLISVPWKVTAGSSSFAFLADSDHRINESNESEECGVSNKVCRTVVVEEEEANNTCNKPNGLCVRAKAEIDPINPGPPIFRLWVNGGALRQPVTVDPLRRQVQQEVTNDSEWKVYEFDVPGLDQNSTVYVAYINDRYDGDPSKDRNLAVDWVEIAGKRLEAESAYYDVGRFIGDYRVWRGHHDPGKDCEQVIPGVERMNLEGMLRFNDSTCRDQTKLGIIQGKIYINPIFDATGKLLSPGQEVLKADSGLSVRLDYNMGTLREAGVSGYYFTDIWQGRHELNMNVPVTWEVKYRICSNSSSCHDSASADYQKLVSGKTVGVDVPSTPPSIGEPFLDVYWYITPK